MNTTADPLDRKRRANRRRQKKRVLRGLCSNCPNRLVPGRWRCGPCQDESREFQRQLRADRKAGGLCPRCGSGDVEEPHVYCVECLAAQRRRYKRELKGPK